MHASERVCVERKGAGKEWVWCVGAQGRVYVIIVRMSASVKGCVCERESVLSMSVLVSKAKSIVSNVLYQSTPNSSLLPV